MTTEIKLDPFTQKRVLETTRRTHFDNEKVYIELAQEFGRRVAMAERDGLPVPIAFEACREHFKIVGRAMIDLADAITLEMCDLKRPGERSDS